MIPVPKKNRSFAILFQITKFDISKGRNKKIIAILMNSDMIELNSMFLKLFKLI